MSSTYCTVCVRQLEMCSGVAAIGVLSGTGRRPALVIADRGDRAWLLVADDNPVIGARFRHHGLVWEIVRRRDVGRALVAEPVPQ